MIVALGGNLPGDYASCEDLLEVAIARLPAAGLVVRARSRWWRSAAWPDPSAPQYRNGVALIETREDPLAVWATLAAVEVEFRRERSVRNAPRTLDLDLIAHGRVVLDGPGLILPHPRAEDRLFVMGPLAEIAPGWRHPVTGRTATEAAKTASVGVDARPV
ncbi:2-amino-4-hydroxy-6-hydroxymethyldihydropteridine diphosphokinase [Phenylobacterium immobile]|uniref:2-amino-4-hydroxy-6- hydroxymethyldihydropteridine diphosphokinase n=1 Tax=Phenylobacterium immobile TaxID=21 RepID=UPI000AFC2C93|nr:2-amino-4-hydroxy-6-hydroxymethyldihydropteridine diphosphokinase [Phenylobacterium immobile]